MASSLWVPPLEGVSEPLELSENHDEMVQVQSPASGVILDQNVLVRSCNVLLISIEKLKT